MQQSLYIHIPFCAKKCLYCDFYSVGYKKALAQSYIEALTRQIKLLDEKFYTVYIGGGTPTSLEANLLKKLLKALSKASKGCAEFTVEANPESLSQEKLKVLRDFGVNRISIGIQSFNNEKLKTLGRIHNAERAFSSVYLAAKNGFSNISIDLIFGVWNETMFSWKNELAQAVRLPIKHISCYSLTYERHTKLFTKVKNKAVIPLSDRNCSEMYKFTMGYLPKKYFRQYEISNFAKRGFECKHNLNYWENNPYAGLGVSAVSFLNGVRRKNISDIEEYVRRIQKKESVVYSTEKLPPEKSAMETAAIKIRTSKGIDFSWFRKKTGFDFMGIEKDAARELVKRKLLKYRLKNGQRAGVSATSKGFLFCDSVSSEFL